MKRRPWWKVALDWLAVWVVVFVSAGLAAFLVDPSTWIGEEKGVIAIRSAVIASMSTAFWAAITWLRQPDSSVPDEVQHNLPDTPPG